MNNMCEKGGCLNTLEIIKKLDNNFSTHEEQQVVNEKRNYSISISTSNNICIIVLKTNFIANEDMVNEYIKLINNEYSPMQYSYSNNQLICKMSNYVNEKISKTVLKEQLSVALSNANSIMCYLQASIKNG